MTVALLGAVVIGIFMVLQGKFNGGLAESTGSESFATLYSLTTSTIFIGVMAWRKYRQGELRLMQLLRTKDVSWRRKLLSGAPGAVFLTAFVIASFYVTGPAAAGVSTVAGMVLHGFVKNLWETRKVSWIDVRGVILILVAAGLVARGRADILSGVDGGFWFWPGCVALAIVSARVAWQFDILGAMANASSPTASSLVSSATGALWAAVLVGVVAVITQSSPISGDWPTNFWAYMGPVAALGIIPIGARVAPVLGKLSSVIKPIMTNVGIVLASVIWELSGSQTTLSRFLFVAGVVCAAFIALDRLYAARRSLTPAAVPTTSLV